MTDTAQFIDMILFIVLPYVAMATFFLVSIYRYLGRAFTYSSVSSQLLENKQHFWGLVPFHYGILVVLAGHVIAFLFPRELLLFNRVSLRLYILETTALVFGLLALIGLVSLILRRITEPKIRVVTTPMDWVLFVLLFVQVIAGVGIAVFYPWGSSWFAAAMTPYLWSLVKLQPDIQFVSGLSFWVKLHVVNAFVLIGLLPFTRLVHVLVAPNPYLWRRPQVVRWYRKPGGELAESKTGRS
ncbi:MAG: Respiratory nitrate reductase 2 gamma chain [Calditrichaeota bacterium]|nr:Respiratory nitrate reductase 2 gamma chain [Calditrichota bacterium]